VSARGPSSAELELLKQYTPLVLAIASAFKRKLPSSVLREDLVAAGMGGLWDAIRRNAGGDGGQFEWYVRVRVRGAILDELRAQDWLQRRARARVQDGSTPTSIVRFDELSEWQQNNMLSQASDAESAIDRKEQSARVRAAIAELPKRERLIVSSHLKGTKFVDLGKRLGVTQARISQIHAQAVGRLRLALTGVAPIEKPKPVRRKKSR
jgi:RNA polymerase sigma factor for flagellar operon FliA